MLKRLLLKNCEFPDAAGRLVGHKHLEVVFEEGTTAVVGPNGVGKSLIIEMTRYALFGIAAARGEAADYKSATIELDFEIKGVPYSVTRRNGDATLLRNGDPLATGTKVVNAKIPELLGYDLTVFDMTNAINQGEIEAMGAMLPAERKRLVDSTIGLDLVDGLVEWAGAEAALKRKEAETLAAGAVEPTSPSPPEGYSASAEIEKSVKVLQALETERLTIEGWLMADRAPPTVPTAPTGAGKDELAEIMAERSAKLAEQKRLLAEIEAIPVPAYTAGQLDAFERTLADDAAYAAAQAELKRLGPEPKYGRPYLDRMLQQHEDHDAWKCRQRLEAKGFHQCPACDHRWPVAGELPEAQEVGEPALTRVDIERQLRQHDRFDAVSRETVEAWRDTPGPGDLASLTAAQIAAGRAAIAQADPARREALLHEAGRIQVPADVTAEYEAWVAYEGALVEHTKASNDYADWIMQRQRKLQRRGELACVPAQLAVAEGRLRAAELHEQLLAAYQAALGVWQGLQIRIGQAEAEADQWRRARAALVDVKARVKTYLVPSLSRVASHLVRQMTAGQHQQLGSIEVSEDFDITVDGKPLKKLNGSGKAVANLAVRIGLGQVLTNKVFPVLMCDEVDAGCDDERAAAIADGLRQLTGTVRQIVIVSHKAVDADHYVDLLRS